MSWPEPAELLTPAEMGRADALALAEGIQGYRLMEAAGRAVARAIRARFRPQPTVVLAGPGNNGGDGYVVARHLEQMGWPVAVAALAPPRPGSDAALAAAAWRGPVRPFTPASVARTGLVVDALFGAGLARPLGAAVQSVLQAVTAPIIAIDVPSGVDGATGQALGYAPQAALTVTFFRLKPGHLLFPARSLCGEVVLADIGLPARVLDEIAPQSWRNGPGLWSLPATAAQAHKYRRGHVTIVAGASMPGAARLAAAAARRTGAGLVSLLAGAAALAQLLRGGDPGLLVTEEALDTLLGDARRAVWLLGPGLLPDAATRKALAAVLAAKRLLVADAGALMAAAGQPEILRGTAVITPHAGEFARVFGDPGQDRPSALRQAAAQIGGVVVLKGPDSMIAAPDGRLIINDNAPASLATAGSGDVLAGLIAGLMAQGMAPFEASAAAVWLHGAAARLGPPGLIAEDLPPLIAVAMQQLMPAP